MNKQQAYVKHKLVFELSNYENFKDLEPFIDDIYRVPGINTLVEEVNKIVKTHFEFLPGRL